MPTILDDDEIKWLDTPYGAESFCIFCGSSVHWEECDQCGGEGVSGHECGEDTCCCLNPEDNVECDICDGEGGWHICLGDCRKKKPTPVEVAAEHPNQTKLSVGVKAT